MDGWMAVQQHTFVCLFVRSFFVFKRKTAATTTATMQNKNANEWNALVIIMSIHEKKC